MARSIKRIFLILFAVVLILSVGAFWILSEERVPPEGPKVDAPLPNTTRTEVIFASQGRVEGLNEPIQIGSAVSGLLVTMPFREGDPVERGQVLARMECRPTESERDIALAEVDTAVASKDRLLRGSRSEERLEAEASTAAAEASLARAKQHYERLEALSVATVMPIDERDQALRDFQLVEQ